MQQIRMDSIHFITDGNGRDRITNVKQTITRGLRYLNNGDYNDACVPAQMITCISQLPFT